jgi:chemotaxis protein methyltransferase CheR
MKPSPAALSATPSPVLSEETFDRLRALIREKTGIHMRDGKQILVANRLRKRLVQLRLPGYEEYYELIASNHCGEEMTNFIDAVCTNETYFFREAAHFEVLADVVLPPLFRACPRVRIWSAGCSSGEEAYTLRIVADRAARTAGAAEPEITATDISSAMIDRARQGIYRDRALRLVPPELIRAFFEPVGEGAFQVKAELRSRVDFQVRNLFDDPTPRKPAHVVFCRNVMIYFDKPTQAKLIEGVFARAIPPGGWLFVGHSESLGGITDAFRYVRGCGAPLYRRVEEGRP